jgi:3-hydroxyisobutyrate dehydrogenase
MVGFPTDVEDMILGSGGVLKAMKKGALLIDHTTSTPDLAVRIAQAAEASGVMSVDAPVSGGDVGAREARLTIMCGGSQEAFDRAVEVMKCYGKSLNRVGGPGKGQHTKCVNQIILAGNMMGMVEGLLYAHKQGLDPSQIIEIIKAGAANSVTLGVLGPRILARDF